MSVGSPQPGSAGRKKSQMLLPIGLRLGFFLALSVGIVGIFGSTLIGVFPDILTIVIPLVAMITYAGLGLWGDPVAAEGQQFADSIYYLGFLFTLLSLIASLFLFSASGQVDFSAFVSRFGLALSTTVVGLGIRVALSSFGVEAEESFRKSEESLAEASYKLRGNVDQISVDVRAQARAMKEVLEVMLEESKSVIGEATESTKKAVAQAADDLRSATAAAGESLVGASNRMSEQLEASGTELRKAHEDAIGETRQAIAKVLDETTRGISQALAASQSAMEKAGQDLNRAVGSVEETVSSATNTLAAEVRAAGSAVVTVQTEAAGALGGLSTTLAAVSDHSKSVGESLEGMNSALGSVQQLQSQLAGVEPILQRLSGLWSDHAEALEKWGRTLKGVNETIEGDEAAIRSMRESMVKQVQEGNEAIEQVQGQLLSVVRYIDRELKES